VDEKGSLRKLIAEGDREEDPSGGLERGKSWTEDFKESGKKSMWGWGAKSESLTHKKCLWVNEPPKQSSNRMSLVPGDETG